MNKRGISPLIVTVITIGIALVLAIIVLNFGGEWIKEAIENENERIAINAYGTQIKAIAYDFNCIGPNREPY